MPSYRLYSVPHHQHRFALRTHAHLGQTRRPAKKHQAYISFLSGCSIEVTPWSLMTRSMRTHGTIPQGFANSRELCKPFRAKLAVSSVAVGEPRNSLCECNVLIAYPFGKSAVNQLQSIGTR